MTDWRAAKVALGAALETAAVEVVFSETNTYEASLAGRVYVDLPPSVEPGMLPCVLIGDAPFEDEWDAALARETYQVQCFLLLRDEDVSSAIRLAEAWRQSIRDVMRQHVVLGGAAQVVNGASFGRVTSIGYARREHIGFTFELPIVLSGPVTFAGGA